jgi:hypothetical protein
VCIDVHASPFLFAGGLNPTEECTMSHKQKNPRQSVAVPPSVESTLEPRPAAKVAQETPKTPPQKTPGEDTGLTWQPTFVLVVIGIGFLVLLSKTLNLF